MNGEFTTLGIIFMITAWAIVIGITVFSIAKVLMNNKLKH